MELAQGGSELLHHCDSMLNWKVFTLHRTYEQANLSEDAVYEEVADHVNRPAAGKPKQQTRKTARTTCINKEADLPRASPGITRGGVSQGCLHLHCLGATKEDEHLEKTSWFGWNGTSWLGWFEHAVRVQHFLVDQICVILIGVEFFWRGSWLKNCFLVTSGESMSRSYTMNPGWSWSLNTMNCNRPLHGQ